MKEQDNLNTFFRKRLLDKEPEVADWNMPSDDLWNNAKVHFPKPKKKRRGFIWFITAGISVLILIVLLNFNSEKTKKPVLTENQNNKTEFDSNTNVKDLTNIKTIEAQKEDRQIADNETNEDLTSKKRKDLNINSSINDLSHKKADIKTASEEIPTKIGLDLTTADALTFGASLSQNVTENIITEKQFASDKILAKGALSTEGLRKEKKPIAPLNIDMIEKRPFLVTQKATDNSVFQKVKFSKTKVLVSRDRNFKRWEVGLSHSPFIISPLELLEKEISEGENYNANTSYSNFNLPISYRISSRFSISSGLSFSKINTDLEFSELEVLEDDAPNRSVREFIAETATLGSLSINDQDSSFITVDFIPGLSFMAGDSILINGMIPLRLKLVQLPIIFNSHWKQGRVEFLSHTGLSIDFFTASISDLELDIYNQDGLISRQVNYQPVSDTFIGISLYVGGGFRFLINDYWNIGLSAKLDLTHIQYSRYEIGTYLRF